MNRDILICGVGGQGTVLASKILAAAAMSRGLTVHSAETIGMAQRGGPVTSHVRIGESAFSPLIPLGGADMLLSFEPSEAVRNLRFLKKSGLVIVNTDPVKPVTESLADTGYDGKEALEYIKKKVDFIFVNGFEECEKLGSQKFLNILLLGVMAGSGRLLIESEIFIKEIERRIPEKYVDMNKRAFARGLVIGEKYEAE